MVILPISLQSSMFVKACKILRVFWKVFTSMYVSFDLVDFGVSSKFEVSKGFSGNGFQFSHMSSSGISNQ